MNFEETAYTRMLCDLFGRRPTVTEDMGPEELEEAIEETEEELKRLTVRLEALRAMRPPFHYGQRVRVRTGSRSGVGQVRSVERTQQSGTWVVWVKYPNSEDAYTYPAERLELA